MTTSRQPKQFHQYALLLVSRNNHLWYTAQTGTRSEILAARDRAEDWGIKCDVAFKGDSGSKVFFA